MALTDKELVTQLIRRVGLPDDSVTGRVDVLARLNEAYRELTQEDGLIFLNVDDTITLNDATSAVVLPATADMGKDIVIAKPSGGQLDFLPPDEYARRTTDQYGAFATDAPFWWKLGTASGADAIFFKPANTTGAGITYEITYQQIVSDLTDVASSNHLLPLQWAETLLLDLAELKLRVSLSAPFTDAFAANVARLREKFYNSYRTNREVAQTDRSQMDRKAYEVQVRPGV